MEYKVAIASMRVNSTVKLKETMHSISNDQVYGLAHVSS